MSLKQVNERDALSPEAHTNGEFLSKGARRLWKIATQWVREDWHTQRYLCFAAVLLILTILPIVAFYRTYPAVAINIDTSTYLHIVDRLQTHFYLLVDSWRLPGYPLLIVFAYALFGQGNLAAVGVIQAVFFVFATLEIYLLAILFVKRAWLACLIGLLVGTNIILISYIKPIMSEGLAVWELTTVALAIAYFVRTMRVSALWLVTCFVIVLFLTRPEWIYLPVPLFAYLLLIAARKGTFRQLWRHALLSLVLIYTILGVYVGVNFLINHYAGVTAIEHYNLFGKVLQYHMQDEAPPRYQYISREVDMAIARSDRDPFHVLAVAPSLARNNAELAGSFAQSIVLAHPVEFVLKSVPFFFASLSDYYGPSTTTIYHTHLSPTLAWLLSVHRVIYGSNLVFPLCALLWLVLLCWKRTGSDQNVLIIGAIVLLVLYGLLITTLAGYRLDDAMRFHIVVDPLMIVVIASSLLMGIRALYVCIVRRMRT